MRLVLADEHVVVSGLVLSDPVGALNRPDLLHAGSSNIYEARLFSELQSGLTQAVMASAAACRETQYVFQLWAGRAVARVCVVNVFPK